MRYEFEDFFPRYGNNIDYTPFLDSHYNRSERSAYVRSLIEKYIENNKFEEIKEYNAWLLNESGWLDSDRHDRDIIAPVDIFYIAVLYFNKANLTNNFTKDNLSPGFYKARRVRAGYEHVPVEDYDTFRDCLFNKLKSYGKSIDTLLNDDIMMGIFHERISNTSRPYFVRDIAILIRFGATESIKNIRSSNSV